MTVTKYHSGNAVSDNINTVQRVALVLALCSGFAVAQNNCSAVPPAGTCPAPASPVESWCAGNDPTSTCPGGTSWVGFSTTAPASGSWSGQFEGLDASGINSSGSIPRPQPDANGAVGPTNAQGVGQYFEYAGGYVQAFDRATGNGIFSHKPNAGAEPQPLNAIFQPGGKSYCANGSLDAFASYDRLDGVFVMGDIFNPASAGTYFLCVGVSAASGSGPVPANNLQGSAGHDNWNVYVYNLNPAIPKNAEGQTYYPDYIRYGTFSDGFYVAFDLEDPATDEVNIVGFEVCQLDKVDMIEGAAGTPPHCYTYIPSYVGGTGGTDASLIHTLVPADFEGTNSVPKSTAGEYFLAMVNPANPGTNQQCSSGACTSNQLAFWTWAGFKSGAPPTFITTQPYTPACYNEQHPFNTVCIPQPYGGYSDGVGDRLMYRLAYRYIKSGNSGTEYLAVAHTIEVNSSTQQAGIRYYKIAAGANPKIAQAATIQDNTYHFFLTVPSVAMDSAGDIAIQMTATGNTGYGSAMNYDASPLLLTISPTGVIGSPSLVLKNSGSSGQDETDAYWGEFMSVFADPNDDLTFWATSEYMKGNQAGNCSEQNGSGCTWASRVYTCKKGSGC